MVSVKAVDIRRAAVDLLARREHSYKELQQKLLRRFSPRSSPRNTQQQDNFSSEQLADMIDEQLQQLVEEKLQSDERYVESFTNGKKNSGKGPIRIRQELRQRGISDYLVDKVLDDNHEDWFELATSVYTKKFGLAPAEGAKEKARRIRFMQYRGYPMPIIQLLLES